MREHVDEQSAFNHQTNHYNRGVLILGVDDAVLPVEGGEEALALMKVNFEM